MKNANLSEFFRNREFGQFPINFFENRAIEDFPQTSDQS